MLFDARNVPNETTIESDICIVGGGAAGITLAKEFTNQMYRVCLLESGGTEPDRETQDLSAGQSVGQPYFSIARTSTRYLGGNTNRWKSWCRPLDDIDFVQRDWIPYSGWPFTRQALMPYYERAQVVCKLRSLDYYDPEYAAQTINKKGFAPLPFNGGKITTRMWQFFLPVISFGEEYLADLKHSPNISLYLFANAVDIETNDTAQTVTQLRVACLSGTQFWVKARVFILAMGGIEVPRLLLASNAVQTAGLGNQHDLVGRFFMEHPHIYSTSKMLITDANHYPGLYAKAHGRYSLVAGLCPSDDFQNKAKILNSSVTLKELDHLWLNTHMSDTFGQRVLGVVQDLGQATHHTLRQWLSRPSRKPRLLSLTARSEQAPNPDSRVTLTRKRDALGLNQIRLDWRLLPVDKRTIVQVYRAIAEELGQAGLGRLKLELTEDDTTWPAPTSEGGSFEGGWHHMGTTRMHSDPKQGVVDVNSRIHSVDNLYIAGSSVFPTGGAANPTLTVVALAIRLADHIKSVYFA